MKTALLIFGLWISPFFLLAQFVEDFSGDSLNNEIWKGDTLNFIINAAKELQLLDEDPVISRSYLVAEVPTGDSTNWEFYARQEFNPSASNVAKIYLSSNNSDLTGPLNGYFIRLGGTTGNADAIGLYRQSGTDTQLLIAGKDSAVALDPSVARIKVTRNQEGLWNLWADYSGGINYLLEGTASDPTYPTGNYFGFVCDYTATRVDKFFFDDLLIAPLYTDNRPPVALDISIINSQQIDLLFDEALDRVSAETSGNYQIDNGINVNVVDLDVNNPALVHLFLNQALVSEQEYTLTVDGVEDQNNNRQSAQSLDFIYFEFASAEIYDILIHEIFADPEPVIGLPKAEYLELYNRSNKLIDLSDFILADNTDEIVLPSYSLFPGAYVILYESGTGDFSPFGDTLALPEMLSLNNDGDDLILYNPSGDIVHAVFYRKSWYQNSAKDDGGWSLEMINPRTPCTELENWRVSENLTGGTPGQKNSVFSNSDSGPVLDLVRIAPLFGGNRLQLFFNKSIDFASASDPNNYQINGLSIIEALPDPVLYQSVTLQLGSVLTAQTTYQLTINPGLTDCSGNNAGGLIQREFGLPEPYGAMDVVINEVLFNPQTNGMDFVELYNRSDKIINLANLLVANRDDSLQISQVVSVPIDYLLLPDRYVVLTKDPLDIQSRYTVENPNAFISMNLPAFDDKEGSVVLFFNQAGETVLVDEFTYSEKFHNELIADKNGVSLERIAPDGISQDPSNWASAAATVGYATPTYLNSQFRLPLSNSNQLISLPYTTFSPNNDGFQDFIAIQYETPNDGYLANVRIFDTQGRLVKELNNNELLGTSGILRWDGSTAEGSRARMGIYLLWIELFSAEGDVQYFKETCVLAGQLN